MDSLPKTRAELRATVPEARKIDADARTIERTEFAYNSVELDRRAIGSARGKNYAKNALVRTTPVRRVSRNNDRKTRSSTTPHRTLYCKILWCTLLATQECTTHVPENASVFISIRTRRHRGARVPVLSRVVSARQRSPVLAYRILLVYCFSAAPSPPRTSFEERIRRCKWLSPPSVACDGEVTRTQQ